MDVSSTVSVIVGAVSIVLAVVAMWQAHSAARESRENSQKTKDALAKIEMLAASIEKTVDEHQRDLMDTVRRLAIPEKPDAGEELGAEFLRSMMQNPAQMGEFLEQLASLGMLDEGNTRPTPGGKPPRRR